MSGGSFYDGCREVYKMGCLFAKPNEIFTSNGLTAGCTFHKYSQMCVFIQSRRAGGHLFRKTPVTESINFHGTRKTG